MDMYSMFAQDSWRLCSTLTLNAGLRWDVQLPFTPVNDILSTASIADICGMSGLGSGSTSDRCNFYEPGASGGMRAHRSPFSRATACAPQRAVKPGPVSSEPWPVPRNVA